MELLQKLASRKLWIAVFFVALAAIDKDLALSVAPIIVTYLISQGVADGLAGFAGSTRSVDPSTGMTK